MNRKLHVVLLLVILQSGCDSFFTDSAKRYPTVVLRNQDGFSVVSEQVTYSQETGSTVELGAFFFKLNGREIGNETISNSLFPEDSDCRSPFYTIWDIRLLPHNSVLALMSVTNPVCDIGRTFLVEISPGEKQLQVRRIPIRIGGTEQQIDHNFFHRETPEGFRYGYERHEERLAIQRSSQSKAVGIVTSESQIAPQHMVMINLDTLSQTDMGEGAVDRLVAGGSIALMRQAIGEGTSQGVEFKAVQIDDGKVVDHALFSNGCFRPVGLRAKDAAMSSYGMLKMDEAAESGPPLESSEKATTMSDPNRENAQSSKIPDVYLSGKDIEFNSDDLSGLPLRASNSAIERMLLGKESRLDWNETTKRIEVTITDEIRKTTACELSAEL